MARIGKRKCLNPRCRYEWYPRKPGRPMRCQLCKCKEYDNAALWEHRVAVGKPKSTPEALRARRRVRKPQEGE